MWGIIPCVHIPLGQFQGSARLDASHGYIPIKGLHDRAKSSGGGSGSNSPSESKQEVPWGINAGFCCRVTSALIQTYILYTATSYVIFMPP